MTNKRATKPKATDWQNRELTQWNVSTFTAYLEHLTQEKFGVTYEPTGRGAKHERWAREKGMAKNAQEKYGNAVLKRFIEICIEEYRAKPEYPYASFTFMYSYMSGNFAKAQAEIAREQKRKEAAEKQPEASDIDSGWF
ncbi:hypothetical protein [Terribacillus saccharophilus]|uniref:hypothetical protein n=1 Tax=Terribacillus saccharophilus TaxID=361277 RepID=UPI003D26962A